MKIDVGSQMVEINLDYGIYATDGDSAEGKTFLFKLLQAAYSAGVFTDSLLITYSPDLSEDTVCRKLRDKQYKFIMLDRADLYLTDNMVAIMNDLAYDTVIFIDIKNWMMCSGLYPEVCELVLDDKRIELYVEDCV